MGMESTANSADSAELLSIFHPNLVELLSVVSAILFFSDKTPESGLTHNFPTR